MRKIIINNTLPKKNEKIKAENHFPLFIFSFSLLKRSFSLFAFLFSLSVFAQTTPSLSENYKHTTTCLDADCVQKTETIQYFDNLGRPKQVVNVKASPTGKDIVQPIEYDGFGRQVKDYLPIPQSGTQNGSIYASPLGNASSVYGAEKIYAEKILENSPLDRVLQQKQVGNAWDTKPVKMEYDANAAGEVIKMFTTTTWVNNATQSTIENGGTYGAGQLQKTTVIDEDGNKTIEFKNGEGQTLLIRKVLSPTENADTYYVYNEYNQLVYTIPPLASKSGLVDQATLDNLCYQYRYDGRNRLVEKKLPGKGWEYMVYDKQDRLVAVQDANLRAKGQWQYTKYDQFGRVAITGIATGSSRITEQNITDVLSSNNVTRLTSPQFNWQGMDIFYGNQNATYPYSTNWVTLLSLNYYDTYPAYGINPPFPATILGKATLTDNPVSSGKSTNSLPVMNFVRNIEDGNWTKNYTYYDTKGRVIGTYSINHLGGYTKTETELDFVGMPKQTITRHKRLSTDTEKLITETFEYDNGNRLLVHKHQVDSNPVEILAQNTYNELSQLKNKKVGGTSPSTPLQSIDYQYNIRGWMTKINDPANLNGKLFGYEIKYNNPVYTSLASGRYNGNIAEIDWKTSNDGVARRYSYAYDALNRLKNGIYSEPNASVPQNNFFNETLGYDLNGNITTLQRTGKSVSATSELIDNLTYNYTGNKLNTVTDASANYKGYPDVSGNALAYDDNGNMKDHVDKSILQIDYNYLNLPNYIKFNESIPGRGGARYVNTLYTYRADGSKLQKIYNYKDGQYLTLASKTTEYLDGFQYEGVASVNLTQPLALKFVPTAEGYFNFENNKYIYSYTDHLGNIRLSYAKGSNGSAEVLEENNYYPFGLKHEGYNQLTGNPAFKYRFNSVELQESGMYATDWRNYVPELGRFAGIDVLSESYAGQTTSHFAMNNPVSFSDPTGMYSMDANGNMSTSNQGEINELFGYFKGGGKIGGVTNFMRGSESFAVDLPTVNISGRGNSNTWNSSENFGYNSLHMMSKITGVLREWNLERNRANYYNAVAETGADKIERDFYLMFGGALVAPFAGAYACAGWTALGSLGSSTTILGGETLGSYLQGAILRGTTDLALQKGIKGDIDWKQTFISTFIGGGKGNVGIKMGWANLAANTTNNFGMSIYDGTFNQDLGINTMKILTGGFGMGIGSIYSNYLGNIFLPSIYGTVTDKVLESKKPKK